ncbi:unnamed protein product [Peronospora belbahrii]|uniref:Chromo domain-containing protein n=1 Tax=Peronospora belbahrii TaxID=622444 RepID=A0AAU9L3Q1_9STRA|nr:unnamed protein product [Peronospora belbahrii]
MNLPKTMRTHPVFYVGLLNPYLNPASVDFEDLSPNPRPKEAGSTVPEVHMDAEGVPGGQSDIAVRPENAQLPLSDPRSQSDNAQKTDGVDRHGHRAMTGETSPMQGHHAPGASGDAQSERDEMSMDHRPPQTLIDEHNHQQFHVESLLDRCRHLCHTQYLVKWRGYPLSYDSWEYEVPLRQDCPDAVDDFDQDGQKQRQLSSEASQH